MQPVQQADEFVLGDPVVDCQKQRLDVPPGQVPACMAFTGQPEHLFCVKLLGGQLALQPLDDLLEAVLEEVVLLNVAGELCLHQWVAVRLVPGEAALLLYA
jgi:hypothetical protein